MEMDKASIDKHLRDVIKRAKGARAALNLGLNVERNLENILSALQAASDANGGSSVTQHSPALLAAAKAQWKREREGKL
jgi:hypothetical protein